MALGIFSRGWGGELKVHYRVDLIGVLFDINWGSTLRWLARDAYRGFGVCFCAIPLALPSPSSARPGHLD